MDIQLQAFFSEGRRQKLFNVLVAPTEMAHCKALLIFLPALWDEMNHSRHMVAAQARQFAADGIATLILDPEGTGDSYGDYAQADWDIWLEDYTDLWEQWSARYSVPIGFWGMRSGALLAGELLNRCDTGKTPLLLWNPVWDGEQALREMLRIKLAGQQMRSDAPASMKDIRAELKNGGTVNAAGYDISGVFSERLVAQKLVDSIPEKTTIVWIDVLRNSTVGEPPAKLKIQQQLADNNSPLHYAKVQGPVFWQSIELEFIPELLSVTQHELQKAL